jgi:hypothetical protein
MPYNSDARAGRTGENWKNAHSRISCSRSRGRYDLGPVPEKAACLRAAMRNNIQVAPASTKSVFTKTKGTEEVRTLRFGARRGAHLCTAAPYA